MQSCDIDTMCYYFEAEYSLCCKSDKIFVKHFCPQKFLNTLGEQKRLKSCDMWAFCRLFMFCEHSDTGARK